MEEEKIEKSINKEENIRNQIFDETIKLIDNNNIKLLGWEKTIVARFISDNSMKIMKVLNKYINIKMAKRKK
ncbi:MAG: hypothetical protein ACP6IY_11365 [Promethearchaeia archaeon]